MFRTINSLFFVTMSFKKTPLSPLKKISDSSIDNINSFLRPSWDFSCISKVCLYDTRTREEVHSIPVDSLVIDVAYSFNLLAILLQNNKILFYKDLVGDYDGHDAKFRELAAELDFSPEFSNDFQDLRFDQKKLRFITFSPLGKTFAVRLCRDSQPTILVYRFEEKSGDYSFDLVAEYQNCYEMVYANDECLVVANAQHALTYNFFNTKDEKIIDLWGQEVKFLECFHNRVIVGTNNLPGHSFIVVIEDVKMEFGVIKDGVRKNYPLGPKFSPVCVVDVDSSAIAICGREFIRKLDFEKNEGVVQTEEEEEEEDIRIYSRYHSIFKLPIRSEDEFIIGTEEGFSWCNYQYNRKTFTKFPCAHFCSAVDSKSPLIVVSGYSPPLSKAINELIKIDRDSEDRYMLQEVDDSVSIISGFDYIINTLLKYKSLVEKTTNDWKQRINQEYLEEPGGNTIMRNAVYAFSAKVMSVLMEKFDAIYDAYPYDNILLWGIEMYGTEGGHRRLGGSDERILECIRLRMSSKPPNVGRGHSLTIGKMRGKYRGKKMWISADVITYAVYYGHPPVLRELLKNENLRINFPRAIFAVACRLRELDGTGEVDDAYSTYERYMMTVSTLIEDKRVDVNALGDTSWDWTYDYRNISALYCVIFSHKGNYPGLNYLEDLAILLVENGALNKCANKWYSPFYFAISNGMVSFVEHWLNKDVTLVNGKKLDVDGSVTDSILPVLDWIEKTLHGVCPKRKFIRMCLKALRKFEAQESAGSGAPNESDSTLTNNIILRF